MDKTLKELSAEWGIGRVTLTQYCRSHGIVGEYRRHKIRDKSGKIRWAHSMFLSPEQIAELADMRGIAVQ